MLTPPTLLDPDAGLVGNLASADRSAREAALRALMDRHAGTLHATATRMLGDAALAEDVVQETFLKVWNRAADWKPGRAQFKTWLTRVTINACLDHLRRKRPATGVEMPEAVDETPLADAKMMSRDMQSQMRTLIDALPERQRAALILSLDKGLSQVEGARALGVSESAYESLLVRARRTLRARFKEQRNG